VLDTVLEVEGKEDEVVAAEFDDFVVDLEDDEDVVVVEGFIVETTDFIAVSRAAVVIPDFREVAPTALVDAPG
jgi:molybdopterin-guanine dinucleotide biosynthesis protein